MYINTSRRNGNIVETTRSWRTGILADNHKGPGNLTQAETPIRRKGESAFAFQKRKNSYYAQIAQNVRESKRYFSLEGGVGLATDSGHSFHTVKYHQNSVMGLWWSDREEKNPGRAYLPVPVLDMDSQSGNGRSDLGPTTPTYKGISEFGIVGTRRLSYEANHLAKINQARDNLLYSSLPMPPVYGFGETIVELASGNYPKLLADLRKRIKEGRARDPKGYGRDLGSEYLNARFGIEPIVKDVIALIQDLKSTHSLLYDTVKRNRTSALIYDGGTGRSPLTGSLRNAGFCTPKETITTDIRLRAKFSKIRPSRGADDFFSQAEDFLFRMGVNPKLTWDLIPYSWLVDWAGNIGKSIMSASILNPGTGEYKIMYAWATRKTSILTYYGPHFNEYSKGHGASFSGTLVSGSEALHRTAVSPFGPSFAFDKLTAYQWSILVSLGFAARK